MNSKKKKLLEESYERIINVALCVAPYEDLSDIVGPNPMVFGTTKDEKVFSFKDLDRLFKSQYEQTGDIEVHLDRERISTDLQQKNRELEIEAAIERVRAVAMGMTKPDDMLDVCRVISDQLQHFGVTDIRNIQTAIINEKIGQYLCYQIFHTLR